MDQIAGSFFHNYSLPLAGSLENIHFVVGVDFMEASPEVVEAEVSGILVVDTDLKLRLIHMDKASKAPELRVLVEDPLSYWYRRPSFLN